MSMNYIRFIYNVMFCCSKLEQSFKSCRRMCHYKIGMEQFE